MEQIDLHVDYLSRFGGGAIFEDRPPRTTDIGAVMPIMVDGGKRMYNLEPGTYLVRFKEMLPDILAQEPVHYDLLQFNLMNLGMMLTVNKTPFAGYLTVTYRSQIEMGSKLASLQWEPNRIVQIGGAEE